MAAKLLVLHFETPETLTHDDYRHFFHDVDPDLSVTVVSPDELTFIITNDEIQLLIGPDMIPVQEFSHLIARGSVDKHRDIVLPTVYVAQLYGVICWNGTGGSFVRSKLAQTVQMQQLGLPIPATVFSMNSTLLTSAIESYFTYPCVVKDWKGSHGNDNFLVHSSEQLAKILEAAASHLSFVAQEFIPNDGDYRYLVVNDQSLTIYRSSAGASHLNNTSQGATATIATHALPRDITMRAHAYAKEYELSIYGADVIQDRHSKRFYFLEFNSQPQLLTGAFLNEKRSMMRRALDL